MPLFSMLPGYGAEAPSWSELDACFFADECTVQPCTFPNTKKHIIWTTSADKAPIRQQGITFLGSQSGHL